MGNTSSAMGRDIANKRVTKWPTDVRVAIPPDYRGKLCSLPQNRSQKLLAELVGRSQRVTDRTQSGNLRETEKNRKFGGAVRCCACAAARPFRLQVSPNGKPYWYSLPTDFCASFSCCRSRVARASVSDLLILGIVFWSAHLIRQAWLTVFLSCLPAFSLSVPGLLYAFIRGLHFDYLIRLDAPYWITLWHFLYTTT